MPFEIKSKKGKLYKCYLTSKSSKSNAKQPRKRKTSTRGSKTRAAPRGGGKSRQRRTAPKSRKRTPKSTSGGPKRVPWSNAQRITSSDFDDEIYDDFPDLPSVRAAPSRKRARPSSPYREVKRYRSNNPFDEEYSDMEEL